MFKLFFLFSEAWKIVKDRSQLLERHLGNTTEALKAYRTLWPKTPYTLEDDAHEAGFLVGYNLAKEKYENS